MKVVLQRVRSASVEIGDRCVGRIGKGLVVLVGVAKGDDVRDVRFIADKIPALRIFGDSTGKMNRSLIEVQGALLVISQFTLLGQTEKGRRPGFDQAAPPEEAQRIYEELVEIWKGQSLPVATGQFGSDMLVTLQNDGPVTFVLDSRKADGVRCNKA